MSLDDIGRYSGPDSDSHILHDKSSLFPTGVLDSGPLIPLKTTLELRADHSVVLAYVTKVPVTAANEVLSLLRDIIDPDGIDLQHLRRFAKLGDLPHHLHSLLTGSAKGVLSKPVPTDLHVLVGPTSSIELSKLKVSLSAVFHGHPVDEFVIHTVAVPLLAPTSHEQALSWSNSHWPTVYKKSNPFGPHPSIVSQAEGEMASELHLWMAMAAQVAALSKSKGCGEAIGAVIVHRKGGSSHAVALAGDGRWKDHQRDGVGNVMAHAVLRAIGMAAQNLKAAKGKGHVIQKNHSLGHHQQDIFLDCPLFPEEEAVFKSGHVSSEGYLCRGLEIYLTHEPCVMCSMALLHSRFGKVVFGQRMPRTGGLCSELSTYESTGGERSLGHGLFCRKELNWCFLAWQFKVKELAVIDLITQA